MELDISRACKNALKVTECKICYIQQYKTIGKKPDFSYQKNHVFNILKICKFILTKLAETIGILIIFDILQFNRI